MTIYFLDTSALVKRYLSEAGSVWVRAITAHDANSTILIAQMTPVEVMSGVARRKREGVISSRTARAIRLLLSRHVQRAYVTIQLGAGVIQHAQDLLEKYPLRAYDAVQLASALVARNRLLVTILSPLIFVSADERLCNIASIEGLAVQNPLSG